MTDKYDAIVVGGGHNGLVCSALLAQSGKQVLLLEANDEVARAVPPFWHGLSPMFVPIYRRPEVSKRARTP